MDQGIKSRWIAALRSGDYQQTQNTIRHDDGYCCLGVLCDVVDQDGWVKDRQPDAPGYYHHTCSSAEYGGLTDQARGDLGLTGAQQRKLIEMNDNDRSTFTEIADHIEQTL